MLAQHRLFLPWQYTIYMCYCFNCFFFINDLILVFVPGILADIIIILPSQDLALKRTFCRGSSYLESLLRISGPDIGYLKPDIRLLQRPDIRPNMQLDLY